MKKLGLLIVMLFASSGANAAQEQVTFVTRPLNGANCTITNSKGAWQVTTPQTVTIQETGGDLNIECNHPSGKYALAMVQAHLPQTEVSTQSGRGIDADAKLSASVGDMYPSEIIIDLK